MDVEGDGGFDVKKIIGIIAEKHGLMLAPDDPVFALLTLNELVLSRYLRMMNASAETVREMLAVAAAQQTAANKELAERTITKGADYVAKQLEQAGLKAADHIAEAARSAQKALHEDAVTHRRAQNWLLIGFVLVNAILTGLLLSSALSTPFTH